MRAKDKELARRRRRRQKRLLEKKKAHRLQKTAEKSAKKA